MASLVQSIVVVGGGTAGWLTAGLIAAEHQSRIQQQALTITLCESPSVPTVGVGEGTWPTMRGTLQKLGLSETEFVRRCHASFKQGSRFDRWNEDTASDVYYHPFAVPEGLSEVNLADFYCTEKPSQSFAALISAQVSLCEQGLAPKQITHPEFSGAVNYGYHLDAGAFTQLLREHCTETLGVRHLWDDVVAAPLGEDGAITHIQTKAHGDILGELFVDCTGFRSFLLGEQLQVPFQPCNNVLMADAAITAHVAYPSPQAPIAGYTRSTAQEAGWIWDIGLQNRRGVGHVYANDYLSTEKAVDQFKAYIAASGATVADQNIRDIRFQAGRRARFWHKNCVAVGLSAGFLEPLEASAMVMIELAAEAIAEQLPSVTADIPIAAKRYNDTFDYHWQRTVEFLKLHYVLSKRQTPFWEDNRHPDSIPTRLADLLALWAHRAPRNSDFERRSELFQAISYQYILYGMAFPTATVRTLSHRQAHLADTVMARNQKMIHGLTETLPAHRDLLEKIHKYGLASI
ncbi:MULTISPECIES: tryptophan halogenase family protein [Marinimicrobium]|uniref:tryptophan halogenase family protein n=1 Tax=Marinimicrobium TaxID=359337 RepID=UPI000408BF7B|nr:tryptophan halogenase family protein [Marinimicrobium agarilyticum]